MFFPNYLEIVQMKVFKRNMRSEGNLNPSYLEKCYDCIEAKGSEPASCALSHG